MSWFYPSWWVCTCYLICSLYCHPFWKKGHAIICICSFLCRNVRRHVITYHQHGWSLQEICRQQDFSLPGQHQLGSNWKRERQTLLFLEKRVSWGVITKKIWMQKPHYTILVIELFRTWIHLPEFIGQWIVASSWRWQSTTERCKCLYFSLSSMSFINHLHWHQVICIR